MAEFTSPDPEKFDASQYAFFGNHIVDEVELGGLDDDDDDDEILVSAIEESYQEVDGIESFSDIDDLAGAFSKLSRTNSEPKAGFIDDSRSRESSSLAEWTQHSDYSTLCDHLYHPENESESKTWSSQSYGSVRGPESNPLHRTSSYTEPPPQLLPQRHQNFSSEPIPMPRPHMLLTNHHPRHPNNLYLPGGPHTTLHSQTSFSGPMSGFPHLAPNTPSLSPPSQWLNRGNFMSVLPHHQNGSRPHLIGQHQQHRFQRPLPPPSFGNPNGAHSQLYGPHMSPSPPTMNNFDAMMGHPDFRDQRPNSSHKNRPNSTRIDGRWPVFRSKYMTSSEIENILRMQLAAIQSTDPYVDDYYHQASIFKRSSSSRLKHTFCPTQLRDLTSRARPNDEPHQFLQVEALGRIPFSSIRRPKPLLEVNPLKSTTSGSDDQKIIDKPLEQEPMLAARVTIEDCLCLLLDVDDMDRFLQFNQFPDGGAELRQRRQNQLEELASSLQLVDPLGESGPTPKNDFVFLHIASLPKGRKLLGKYLSTLSPSSDLLKVVCMAVFRHLRFFFGVLPSDTSAAMASAYLGKVMSSLVIEMNLNGLGACLAAVVCSSEQPPLRPIGSSVGDIASILLKSVLDRASQLVRDLNGPNTTSFWQASFDEFFNLLLKYCLNKYDSIVGARLQNTGDIGADVAIAIKKEMPVELLRASLPHTSEHQRKLLLDLAQRSVPLVGS